MQDKHQRNIDYMRISITDRCNLRCIYCMPEQGVEKTAHDDLLSYEQIIKICCCAKKLGIDKIKLTGGEPLVRKNVAALIFGLKQTAKMSQVTLTTNGVLFPPIAKKLVDSGLDGVNISLDCLDQKVFEQITRKDEFKNALLAIDEALRLGIKSVKINFVAIDNINSDQITAVAALTKNKKIDVRFIELMPLGLGKKYSPLSNAKVFASIEKVFGILEKDNSSHGNGPAQYYKIPNALGSIGFISPMSESFCASCNRVRLSAQGDLKLCLHHNNSVSLKPIFESTQNQDELLFQTIKNAIYNKPTSHEFNNLKSINNSFEQKNMFEIGG